MTITQSNLRYQTVDLAGHSFEDDLAPMGCRVRRSILQYRAHFLD